MDCSTPGFLVLHSFWSLIKLTFIELMRPSNHLFLCWPLLLMPSIFPRNKVFPVIQFFTSGGQSIGTSASASVLPMNIQDWFPLGWTGWISLQSKGTLKHLLQHHSPKALILWCSAFFIVQLSHPYMTTRKTITLTRRTFVGKVMFLLFNMLSSLVIAFFPRSKHLLISWLQSPSAVILEPRKIKPLTVSIVSPSISHEVIGPDAMILVFCMLNFKPAFSLSSLTHQEALKFVFTFCHKGGVICVSEVIDIFSNSLDSSLCFIQPRISHDVLCI